LRTILATCSHHARWPFLDDFSRELIRVESEKKDQNIRDLEDFEELKASAWLGLESLGYEIVRHFQPTVVVELGTHMGLSALAMGMALRDLGKGGRLYAVDTWQGDEHAGSYDDYVYRIFIDRRDRLGLEEVIVPLRMTFEEARDRIPSGIDLLHIDGLHTLDAVTHDFETFGPLVRPGGLVLFHDVNTGFQDMRRFWRSLKRRYRSHLFPYSHGLGVIRMPIDCGREQTTEAMAT